MQPVFTIGEAVSYGWKKTWEHVGFLALLTLGFFVVSMIIGVGIGEEIDSIVEAILQLLNILISNFAMFVFVHIGLKIYRGEKPQVSDVFGKMDWKLFGIYLVSSFLSAAATTVGFLLLIIPGIFLVVRFAFFSFALIDLKLGPVQALKKSFEITRGRFWHLLGFSVVLVLVSIAGFLALGIGLLVTSPLCLIATAYVYEKIKASPVVVPSTSVPTA